ncbi:DUF6519 domain-containing protein [Nannocystaceae bacterium ST9]
MHGDLSRTTFDPTKVYSSVRSQQGRATLDADLNEQVDIQLHDLRTGRRALIGPSGGHVGEALDVQVVGNQPKIQAGRYWVDGIEVAHVGAALDVGNQPALPGLALPVAPGLYLAYLDVWERPISAVQDPEIREVALGGPDTSTRTQIVWQVRLLKVTTNDPQPDSLTPFPEWSTLVAGPQGTLQVRVSETVASNDPCLIPASAGFRGLENQLYRVQIHAGNFAPTAANGVEIGAVPSFKWSRDNGSVVATWREHPSPLELAVDRLGPGGAAGFHPNDWVELTNDHDELLERGGVIGRIASVDADTLLLDDADPTLEAMLSPAPKSSAALHSQVRRWDSAGTRGTAVGVGQIDVTNDGWIRLEDGIEVKFSNGPFRPGSYWTIPARTASLPGTLDKQIDWPTDGNDVPLALPAQGPNHHYARLALLQLNGVVWTKTADCRQLFPTLTELVQVQTRGGDGQHGRANHWLPAPVRVAVVRGGFPVAGARVTFSIVPSAIQGLRGHLSATMPNENGQIGVLTSVTVVTDAQGQASAWWQLGAGQPVEELDDTFQRDDAQEVTATLLAPDDSLTPQAARFTASVLDNYVLVDAGGDAQVGWPGEVLEIALRARVSDGGRPVPGAVVEFAVLNTAYNGAAIDQFAGGSLLANAPKSTVLWPNGNLIQSTRVWTNAMGIAQVQWKLGNHPNLPVQRVEARLIDEAGQPTQQSTLFTAHHLLAREVGWTIPAILTPHLPNPANHLQAALEGVAKAFERLGLPQWAIQPRVVDPADARLPIAPTLSVALANFVAIDLQAIFPVGFAPAQALIDNAIAVWMERPFNGTIGHTRLRLNGAATQQGTTLNWVMAASTRTWLNSNPVAPSARVTVELMPSALGMFGHPHQWMFMLTP